MKVNSVVKLNLPKIRQLTDAQVKALEETAEALHTNVVQEQVVPRDTGNLQNESFFADYSASQSGRVTLVHSTPYARKLYFHPEYHFSKDENQNAKGKWFADWQEGGRYQNFAMESFKEIYRRIAGL